ncbi:MAG: tRNA uridine-5-carboxymethylaminomethyl(34) synthesis enzyme MnmG [Phycisphaerales bacterium]|nr:MAG: tRNA uridine-5-carboxymethylaminomethyl(34) synthesis enzyme MnmG [Phycisphaerales bacterium]
MQRCYDIVVIGGGHAGVEAAWTASRLGANVALVTMEYEAIGRMSCNPAIGGLGKGQIVREIDALGGLMGLATDRAGIEFRMLNRSKGPAVWAPRAQADRAGYSQALRELLEEARSIDIIEGLVEEITHCSCPPPLLRKDGAPGQFDVPPEEARVDEPPVAHQLDAPLGGKGRDAVCPPPHLRRDGVPAPDRRVTGVTLRDGRRLDAWAVIVATGTFLRGLMHCGDRKTEGGRVGEQSATKLSLSLQAMGLELVRLKTGTPPRLHRDSIDYSQCEEQTGDEIPTPFSYMTDSIQQKQISCWITWTNRRVHEPILANLDRAPLYTGQIESTGPRYCPSIEDKVVRFADKPRHQVFLEPEGYDNERIYCNGVSTSLPDDVQEAFVHEIPGLQKAKILQYGYAIEYDYAPTHQIADSLETKQIQGLFLAGQINGTSGYEEAGGQGLIAGINAARLLRGYDPIVLGRDQAYIGVMIDDLITSPPSEPYRMFTSRAEYRLLLRADNADQRLTSIGREVGTVDDRRWARFEQKREALKTFTRLSEQTSVDGVSLYNWMRRPDANLGGLADSLAGVANRAFCCDVLEQALIEAKYAGYVERQARQIERLSRLEALVIPPGTDYGSMTGLRLEAKERLARVAPRTLGQAGRISGITPADVTVLWIHVTGRRSLKSAS